MPVTVVHHNRQAGFSLLEVMVALVVLVIGIGGTMALQTVTLRGSQSAYHQTVATQLADNLVQRVRMNTRYVNGNPQYDYLGLAGQGHAGCYTTSGCSATQQAQNDWLEWQRNVANMLPSGSGFICRHSDVTTLFADGEDCLTASQASDCNDSGGYLVVVRWQARHSDQSATASGCNDVWIAYEP